LDYRQEMSARELVDVLRNQPPRAGDIILMHDDRPHTIELLDVMLPERRAAGFAMDALPDNA
ncbi:MAG TPA: polysaccharide deacetylase family protein, partial [Rhodanobacteraceae bacterium]|nr:polysaccharide deacetylase family protein [Rhodanobacteraceae bacterium]